MYSPIGVAALDSFNIHHARMVAHELLALKGVQSIEMYGHIARGFEDDHIRLVIVVSQETYTMYNALFQTTFQKERENDTELIQIRKIAAVTLWGKDWPDFHLWEEQPKIDVLVLPADWRIRRYSLQEDLRHDNQDFLRELAYATKTLASNSVVMVSTDENLRRLIRTTLTAIGYAYEIHGSTGGQDHAVTVTSRHQPNRLIVDIDEKIEIEFIRRVRKEGYLFPVCLIHTNLLSESDVRWVTDLGVVTMIQKPVTAETLRAGLVEYLGKCSQ